MAEVGASNVTPPEEVDLSQISTQPPEVVKVEEAPPTKTVRKPTGGASGRKPRAPRVTAGVAKLAAISETPPPQELTVEFWAGLMQTQKVVMARRKSERYNCFRIT